MGPLSITTLLIFVLAVDVVLNGDPLYLTTYLDKGNVSAARELSQVRGLDISLPPSHAGFITADRELRNHLFFWFFPSAYNLHAPLLVWLNGGPTVSSMIGLLWEHGPIRIQRDETGNVTYKPWESTWVGPFSVLYIDNPVGSGYSYTESGKLGLRLNVHDYSKDLHSFLEQFYCIFPEYLNRELYIGGQSYAGKYVPAVAFRIYSSLQAGTSQLPLTGIYLGGPYFDPLTQSEAYSDYFYALGAITRRQVQEQEERVSNLQQQFIRGELLERSSNELLNVLFPSLGLMSMNNIVTLEDAPEKDIEILMRSETLRNALHVGNLEYNAFNGEVASAFGTDVLVSTKSELAQLMDNYKVLLYTGDLDAITSAPMVEAAIASTPWSFQEQYNEGKRSVWKSEGQVCGFYTYVGQFCRVVVHSGGHHTPHDQPKCTLEMMKHFVQHGCICHLK